MKAIVLAAGVARRLAPLTDHTHKCLLPIAGRHLLDRMLGTLAATGVDETVIVVGHCQDQVRAAAGTRHGDMRISFVENPEYQKGSILSLWRARATLASDSALVMDADVLQGVDLVVEPGETVALVGPSGAGKSTLLSLLMLFSEPTSGRILVGDDDLADVDPRAWRRLTAYVPQRPTLFRGTVADNIRLGDVAASDAAVREAAAQAAADGFVRELPDGYGTVVGDGGRPLSAGQVRRIALARAFLRDAPFVILDEPTADLDPASAEAVGAAVKRLLAGRTVLLVTHRSELEARADRVVRLGVEVAA
jgi:ABC-type multidrug transport system fused ATPase/permease subunit